MAEEQGVRGGERGMVKADADASAAAEHECQEICWQLEESRNMAVEDWEREMEEVLKRVQAAGEVVFAMMVKSRRAALQLRLVHFAALYGSRVVLEEACTRTPGGPAEAAQAVETEGNMLLHLAVQSKHLSAEDIRWVMSLHTAAAETPNGRARLPLHLLAWKNISLTPELVDMVLEAHPQALRAKDQQGKLPLHCACENTNANVQALRHLAALHPAAASAANQDGEFPLHLLVGNHRSLTPELVDAVLEAYPQALHIANRHSNLPLQRACGNPHLAEAALRHLLTLDSAAAAANSYGSFPLHVLVQSHMSLTPELTDLVVEAHPPALQSKDRYGRLPLLLACANQRMTAPALRYLVSLDAAAAHTPDQPGNFSLHLLALRHRSLTKDLVDAVVDAHPQALQIADQNGKLPLHCACDNTHMTAEGFGAMLWAFTEAAAIPDCSGRPPFMHLTINTPIAVRFQLAQMLMEATDNLFPYQTFGSNAGTASLLSSPRYVPPPPNTRWTSRPHPLSQQGRLKAGLRVAVRGCENVWQFQTGGGPQPGRAVVDDMSLVALMQAGHRSLVRQRLAHLSGVVAVAGVNEAVFRALELGHADVVRDLLSDGSSSVRISCSQKQACEWLGALMRHRHVDYGWLVEWMHGQRCVWGGADVAWLCLGAAACAGSLALVESMAAAWQTRRDAASAADKEREELAERAVAGGSVAVLRWLQVAELALLPMPHHRKRQLSTILAKHDRLEMMELLRREERWWPDFTAVRAAMESGQLAVLRWLHGLVHFQMSSRDMSTAIYHGHAAVVHFLHRHRNVTRASGDHVLAEALRHSAPGTLGVLEYVLQHEICGGGDEEVITKQLLVNACTATTVRVEVVRYLMSRASEDVMRVVEEDLLRLGWRQAQDVFRAARLRLSEGLPAVSAHWQAQTSATGDVL